MCVYVLFVYIVYVSGMCLCVVCICVVGGGVFEHVAIRGQFLRSLIFLTEAGSLLLATAQCILARLAHKLPDNSPVSACRLALGVLGL